MLLHFGEAQAMNANTSHKRHNARWSNGKIAIYSIRANAQFVHTYVNPRRRSEESIERNHQLFCGICWSTARWSLVICGSVTAIVVVVIESSKWNKTFRFTIECGNSNKIYLPFIKCREPTCKAKNQHLRPTTAATALILNCALSGWAWGSKKQAVRSLFRWYNESSFTLGKLSTLLLPATVLCM